MQDSVPGTICCCTGTCCLFTAKIHALTAELALINLPVFKTREWHTKVLQFVHRLGCCAAHVFNCVLVTEVIAALDGIEHVPVPVIRTDIGERCVNATLCG